MKTIFIKLLVACTAILLTGCAGMPDMKGLSAGIPGMKGLLPSGSSSPSLLETGMNLVKSGSEAMREIPEAEEIGMGEKLMSGVLGAAPLYANDRIQRYVNDVGRWIALHSERPNLPWRFAVLDSPLANAGAAPGGQIYITTGLLFRMRSEAELAGALGHEIAHVVMKHHLNAYQKKFKGDVLKGLGTYALGNVKVGGGAAGQALKATAIDFGTDAMKSMILLPLDRSEEEQADRMGMVLATRAGYDPWGLPTVIQILQDISGDQGGLSVLFSTHPAPADRLASLDKAIGKSLDQYSSQPVLQERFVTMILGQAPADLKKDTAPAKAPPKVPAKTPAKNPQ